MRTITHKEDARGSMAKGVQKLTKAVGATLGPYGRTVTVWKGYGIPMTTKDGVSVAKEVILEDFAEAAGAELVKAAAKKTAEEAGDGTTTATLLANGLIEHGLEALEEGRNILELRAEYETGLVETTRYLEGIKRNVENENDLVHVTSISANDKNIGLIIGDHLSKVGPNGLSTVEIGIEPGISVKHTKGYRFDKGWLAPQFVADPSRLRTLLDKCAIYMTPRILTAGVEVVPIFEAAVKEKNTKCLLMIVGGMESEALATAIFNRQKDMIDVVVVKGPGYGERREELLGDIAAYTGGKMHGEEEQFEPTMLGLASHVEVDRMGTTIIEGESDEARLAERMESIETLHKETKSEFDRKELAARREALQGEAVAFSVGGRNETEALELYHRVEDAVLAARAAQRGGLLPGGGMALIGAYKALVASHPYFGIALLEPAFMLLKNASLPDGMERYLETDSPWEAFSFEDFNGKAVDLYAVGVVDPYEVTVSALRNAVASALLVLSTDVLIVEEPEKKA